MKSHKKHAKIAVRDLKARKDVKGGGGGSKYLPTGGGNQPTGGGNQPTGGGNQPSTVLT